MLTFFVTRSGLGSFFLLVFDVCGTTGKEWFTHVLCWRWIRFSHKTGQPSEHSGRSGRATGCQRDFAISLMSATLPHLLDVNYGCMLHCL